MVEQEVQSLDSGVLKALNPYDGSIIAEFQADDISSIQSKLELLRQGRGKWRGRSVHERVEIVQRVVAGLINHKQELAHCIVREIGKPIREARAEIDLCIERIKQLIAEADRSLATEELRREHAQAEYVSYEPLGVIGVLSSWNYPLLVGVNILIPGLLAGNTIAYKPSEYATVTCIRFVALLRLAGVPEDALQSVVGGSQTGVSLFEEHLDGYFLTGTTRTGRAVAQKIASRMAYSQFELGGKDPLYITENVASIGTVAKLVVEGAFYNAGQSCCAVKRIYVHERVYQEFLAAFLTITKALRLGDPMAEDTTIGPLTTRSQASTLLAQVSDAVQGGATLLTGGDRWAANHNFFMPTILCDVNHDMTVMKEESFGPLVGVMKVSGDDEAVSLMQDSAYGLTASVFCDDHARGSTILAALDVGTVYLNCCDRVSTVSPWAGRRGSGICANHSTQTIRTYLQTKAYYVSGSA
jgi:acyl-CoA reductase-like NAD-dependent aldehyde dehydrogenase